MKTNTLTLHLAGALVFASLLCCGPSATDITSSHNEIWSWEQKVDKSTDPRTFFIPRKVDDIELYNTMVSHLGYGDIKENTVDILRKILVDFHANPNWVDKEKLRSPLLVLVASYPNERGLPVARLLLEYGANPNVVDAEGFTPLSTVFQHVYDINGRIPMAELLLEYGADVNLVVPGHGDLIDMIFKNNDCQGESYERLNYSDKEFMVLFALLQKYHFDSSRHKDFLCKCTGLGKTLMSKLDSRSGLDFDVNCGDGALLRSVLLGDRSTEMLALYLQKQGRLDFIFEEKKDNSWTRNRDDDSRPPARDNVWFFSVKAMTEEGGCRRAGPDLDVLDLLLKNGFDVNSKNDLGATALELVVDKAARYGSYTDDNRCSSIKERLRKLGATETPKTIGK